MTLTPHTYQLKGSAQLLWLSESPWKGGLCGDPMGLSKTLQATLVINAVKMKGTYLLSL
jgi:SNF2 family DNA or RNA helicase